MATEEIKTDQESGYSVHSTGGPLRPFRDQVARHAHNPRRSRGAVIAFADPRAVHRPSQPTFHSYRVDPDLRGLDGIVAESHEEGQAHPDRQGAGDLHADHQRAGLPRRQRRRLGRRRKAMTAAEAQAFKRACSCFGLGRYLYNFAEMWVPLNEYRQPMRVSDMPHWALPKG